MVGTDVFHAAILLWAAGLAHVNAGNVDFALVGTILIGSVPGVWVGSHFPVVVMVLLVVTMARNRRARKDSEIQIPSGM